MTGINGPLRYMQAGRCMTREWRTSILTAMHVCFPMRNVFSHIVTCCSQLLCTNRHLIYIARAVQVVHGFWETL